jgi:hypothetical protein
MQQGLRPVLIGLAVACAVSAGMFRLPDRLLFQPSESDAQIRSGLLQIALGFREFGEGRFLGRLLLGAVAFGGFNLLLDQDEVQNRNSKRSYNGDDKTDTEQHGSK